MLNELDSKSVSTSLAPSRVASFLGAKEPMPEKKGGKAKRGANLGRSIMRQQFRMPTQEQAQLEYDRGKHKLRSLTQCDDLEELMSNAVLAGTDFSSRRGEIVVLATEAIQKKPAERPADPGECELPVPRRPKWQPGDDAETLDEKERTNFLAWRRHLADVEESSNRLLTPFEKNLEVWRQLWRVLERSQLIVQIVDARNPLLFRSVDLEQYAREIDSNKACVLLVNKADLLTRAQRQQWAEYFCANGIEFVFWSAAGAQADIEASLRAERAAASSKVATEDAISNKSHGEQVDGITDLGEVQEPGSAFASLPRGGTIASSSNDDHLKVLNREELLDLFLRKCPEGPADRKGVRRRTVGLVGYPNVGKSSTVNALVAAIKTSVSATPGKTKHFQTLLVPGVADLMLCDCPGLVFPSVAGSKAQMICDGVLPIDQMTDYVEPIRLLVSRLDPEVFFHTYGVRLRSESERVDADDASAPEPARELLIAFALSRGFMTHTKGGPDESRSARIILKDLVNAKLLHCMSPPGVQMGAFTSNPDRAIQRRMPREPTADRWLKKEKANHEKQHDYGARFSGRNAAGGLPPWRAESKVPDRLVARGKKVDTIAIN